MKKKRIDAAFFTNVLVLMGPSTVVTGETIDLQIAG